MHRPCRKGGPPRRAHDHFRHTSVFRTLFDQQIIPTAPASAPQTPPLPHPLGPQAPPLALDSTDHASHGGAAADASEDPVLYSGFSSLLGGSGGRDGSQHATAEGAGEPAAEEVAEVVRPRSGGARAHHAAAHAGSRQPAKPGQLQRGCAGGQLRAELLGVPVDARVAGGNRVARPRVITAPRVSRQATARAAALQSARGSGTAERWRAPAQRAERKGAAEHAAAACARGRAVSTGARSAAADSDRPAAGPAVGERRVSEAERQGPEGRRHGDVRHRDVLAAAAAVSQL